MYRLQQLLQNSFIRLEGLLYQTFGLIRKIFGFFYLRLVALLQLLGFSKSSYYVESDSLNSAELAENQQVTGVKPEKSDSNFTPNRRPPNPQMEYYRNLAGQVNPTKNRG